MKDLEYWIWLSRIEGITPKRLLEILEIFKTPEALFNKTKEELFKSGISLKDAEKITKKEYRNNLKKYLDYMQKNNIDIITINDKFYPIRLKQIYDPPVVIYLRGNKNILNDKSVAIVGSRICTNYGKETARKIAYDLSKNSINIISGLAKGIDANSHIGSLQAKGKTIGVMGCGLDRVYPRENEKLFNDIIKLGGAVISEYVVGTRPLAKNFPRRNRIISGMSDGVLVVEAKEKSGTLITVDFALEQGKELYCIPGNIDSPNSYGTNEFIKQGAKLVTNAQDILEDM